MTHDDGSDAAGLGDVADRGDATDRGDRGRLQASRRAALAGGGVLGAAAVGGLAGWRVLRRATRGSDGPPESAVSGAADGREDFLWVWSGASAPLRDNMLAYADRHGASVAYTPPGPTAPGVGEAIRPGLEAARSFGVDPWFNVGLFYDVTAEEFVREGAARERHLAGLREVARVYDDVVGGGRVVLWQEAPVMGNWAAGEEWGQASVDNLREYGPAVFEAQRSALREANPDLEVGIFVHFPYLVDSKQPEVFAGLADDLRERGAMPEFGFADYYRGWYEKDVGPDPADDAVRSLVSNAREHLDGREVFYMGQSHTINPGHTPSRQAMRSNLRAALEAGASGVGWYPAGAYKPTEQGFDPFVPNAPDATFGDGPTFTPTFARDRFQYAYAATLGTRADVAREDRFDLWLHGHDWGFYDRRVEARSADGEWVFLGDAGGYLDGDYPHAGARTTVFRALARDRFAADGELELRIETGADADGGTLEAVVAMPWDPVDFVTAAAATALLDGGGDVGSVEIGRATPGRELPPGDAARVTVPVEGDPGSLRPLVHPEHADVVRRLAAAEEREAVDPSARFDLWVAGSGLADPAAAPSLREAGGDAVRPADASFVAVSTSETALFYGLERDRFLRDGLALADDAARGTRVEAAYAMPYAGRANFRPPAEAAALLTDQPGAAATFSVAWSELS
jgi:hypothetical protein